MELLNGRLELPGRASRRYCPSIKGLGLTEKLASGIQGVFSEDGARPTKCTTKNGMSVLCACSWLCVCFK